MQSQEIHRALGERFLYVTFDIIEERVIEVKKFGACARRIRRRQQAGGSPATARGTGGQQRMVINKQALNINTKKCVNRY